MTARDADIALQLASFLYNSKEFQDSVRQLSFPFSNNCNGCGTGSRKNKTRISGTEILDKLFLRSEVQLNLRLDSMGKKPRLGRCWSLGNTCPGTDSVTSFFVNIDCVMGDDFPFVYAYAVHLSHEFMHNVGYCHNDNTVKNDIAEAMGEIAYYFIKKWYDEGKLKSLAVKANHSAYYPTN